MRYYSRHRPVAPGTFPRPEGNRVTEIVNYDERQFCPEIVEMAWGYLEYEKPLNSREIADYELTEVETCE